MWRKKYLGPAHKSSRGRGGGADDFQGDCLYHPEGEGVAISA